MKRFTTILFLLFSFFYFTGCSTGTLKNLMYVGTYTGKGSEGIYKVSFNPETGESGKPELAARTENPSFIDLDPNAGFLFAVNELDTFQNQPAGAITAYLIEKKTGNLRMLQQVSSVGQGPAHLSLDKSFRNLFVANYGGGNVAVFPIGNDGLIMPHTSFIQHNGSSIVLKRQAGPHAHFIHPDKNNRFVMAADLGIDKIMIYNFDPETGNLTPGNPAFAQMEPGSGPRHFVFSPDNKYMYVVNEINSSVTVFNYDGEKGTLSFKQKISTLPDGFNGTNSTAEIVVDYKGKFLYVSNRGENSIAVFSINSDGSLSYLESVPSGGDSPRNFIIDPSGNWLLAANQRSNIIQIFKRNPDTGKLTPTDNKIEIVSPVCIKFL